MAEAKKLKIHWSGVSMAAFLYNARRPEALDWGRSAVPWCRRITLHP
jgi:hypothetical protein